MADTVDSLDDLSDPQREALQWLRTQPVDQFVDPPSDHRGPTWKALETRELVQRDDNGNVRILDAGAALFPAEGDAAPVETTADAATGTPETATETTTPVEESPGAGADDQVPGTVRTEDTPAETATADDGSAPDADGVPSRTVALIDLRPGTSGTDSRGGWRVLGIPERLHGPSEGKARVLVMRTDTASRDYLRGALDDQVAVDD